MEPIFECDICNRCFAQKFNLERHKNKKKICVKQSKIFLNNPFIIQNNPRKNTEIESIIENKPLFKYDIYESNDNNNTNHTFNNNNYYNTIDMNDINNKQIQDPKNNMACGYCSRIFLNKSNLNKHIKTNCKVKKADDKEKENTFKMLLERDKQRENEINELKKQNKLFEEQNKILMYKIDKLINMKSSKTINNNQKITNNNQKITNTQNNTQNNFVMVNFGKEDLKIIDEREFIDRIVKQNKISGVKIPDEVLKIIHFNPKYPQLSNIYISDINREKCMVYEDGEWKLSNIDNVPQVLDKICLFSKDQIEILREKYPNNKPLNDRLNTIEKYNNKINDEYVQDLREDEDYNNVKILIKDAEDFQKYAYSTIKKTLYNEGKKLKRNIKIK